MAVTVIGVDAGLLPHGAEPLLGVAALVVGSRAALATHAPEAKKTLFTPFNDSVLDSIAKAVAANELVVVLAEGDAGHFGVLRTLRARGLAVVSLPAVSAVARAAAVLGRPWDDLTVVDVQGNGFGRAVNVCRARKAVAVLCAPGAGPVELSAALAGWRRTFAIVQDPGGPAQRVSVMDVVEAGMPRSWHERTVVFCVTDLGNPGAPTWISGGEPSVPVQGWALEADAFAHRDGLVASPEIRALALAKLGPAPGTLLWDVGAGCGAVGVEAARLGAAVIAVEQDPAQCVRIVANANAFSVEVRLVDEPAPAALKRLPTPDSVFVGAGGADVMRACAGARAARVVIAVHDLARIAPARDALVDAGYQVDGRQLSAAPLHDLAAGGGKLGPAGSSFLLWGVRP